MAKYRKKPIVIEAFQWTGDRDQKEDPYWMCRALQCGLATVKGEKLLIHTLEGVMEGNPGDYIICGVKDEIYPCKPDIFEETYELAT